MRPVWHTAGKGLPALPGLFGWGLAGADAPYRTTNCRDVHRHVTGSRPVGRTLRGQYELCARGQKHSEHHQRDDTLHQREPISALIGIRINSWMTHGPGPLPKGIGSGHSTGCYATKQSNMHVVFKFLFENLKIVAASLFNLVPMVPVVDGRNGQPASKLAGCPFRSQLRGHLVKRGCLQ